MNDASGCRPRTLAQHGNLRVDLCGCGQVHVTIGAFTVRLDRVQYRRLCDTLLNAVRALPEEDTVQLH